MIVRPDAAVFAFLSRARRRVTLAWAARGVAVGLAIAIVLGLFDWPQRGVVPAGLVLGAVGAAVALVFTRSRRRNVALLVERRAPDSRNLIVTAAELPHRNDVADHIASLVNDRAAHLAGTLDLSRLFPARNTAIALVAVTSLWVFVAVRAGSAGTLRAVRAVTGASALAIDAVDVTVTPPAYSGMPARTLRDPERVQTLVGSRVHVVARTRAIGVTLETVRATSPMVAGDGAFAADVTADADGYIALAPSSAGRVGARRLIGLSVIPDESPRVRITAPARDLVLENAHQTIALSVEASDDMGLASLRVRFTRVSGSGERFTFTEGDVPLSITRRDAKTWTARASWRLDSLALGPGDMVVYRALATDHRPGAAAAESDAFIAELPSPGGQAAPGFAVDPEQERYAVSQQMVILKTERLIARRGTMPASDLTTAAQEIAVEQRKVRAEFVFMMGGELGEVADETTDMTSINEEAEAAGEDDLLAGRAANQGRLALVRAIRSMSRAATSLQTADLTTALTHERAALTQLERAFARSRILLRALSEHERLDLTRRLTGSLADAARSSRPRAEAMPEPRVIALRRVLAGIATLGAAPRYTDRDAQAASALAESVLRVNASDTALHRVATSLTSAAAAMRTSRTSQAHALLDGATMTLSSVLRADLIAAPGRAPASELDRLRGALNDALRRSR